MATTLLKIKKVARLFHTLFIILFVALPLFHLITWITAPAAIDISGVFGFWISAVPQGVDVLHPLSFFEKLSGCFVSLLPLILLEMILYFLIQLFKLYGQGHIFLMQNVNYIKKIGYLLLFLQFVEPVSEGLTTIILTLNNPPGHRYALASVSGANLSLILISFLIILISWIMTEGCRLCEEQQLTI